MVFGVECLVGCDVVVVYVGGYFGVVGVDEEVVD